MSFLEIESITLLHKHPDMTRYFLTFLKGCFLSNLDNLPKDINADDVKLPDMSS
jgi:hypothetical protein